jgi:hypothetical protein
MDKNGNGTLSEDEVPEQMKQFFGRIDMNNDGEVNASEAAVLVGRMSGGRGRRGGPGGRRGGPGGRRGGDRQSKSE